MKERVADYETQPLITTCSIFEKVASLKFVIEIFVILIRRDTIFSCSFDCNPWLKIQIMLQYSCKKNSFGKPAAEERFFLQQRKEPVQTVAVMAGFFFI